MALPVLLLLAASSLPLLLAASAPPLNLRPIIGIVANGPNDTSILPPYDVHDAYIAASYVKHVEAAGGRAVPIPWFLPADEVRAIAKSLNGFLLPGGGTHFFQANGSLSGYGATTKILFDETLAAWAAGETLPLWGTCLGHEMTLTHAAGDSRTIDKFGYVAENVSYPIVLTPAGASSRLWGTAPAEVLEAITQWNVTINLHEYGISSADFAASPAASLLAILSTNVDANGKEFVSSSQCGAAARAHVRVARRSRADAIACVRARHVASHTDARAHAHACAHAAHAAALSHPLFSACAAEGLNGLPIYTTQFHPEKASASCSALGVQ